MLCFAGVIVSRCDNCWWSSLDFRVKMGYSYTKLSVAVTENFILDAAFSEFLMSIIKDGFSNFEDLLGNDAREWSY